MKKIFFSIALTIGCWSYGFATNQITIQTQTQDTKEDTKKKAKIKRYEFSLFKFIVPTRKTPEVDSSRISDIPLKMQKSKDETTFHQENPFAFFKFS